MKRQLINFLFAAISAAVCVAVVYAFPPQLTALEPQRKEDIAGKYGCEGKGQDGKAYQVDLQIEKRNDTYGLTWSMEGETSGIGIGVLKGNVLSVIFQTPRVIGLAAYRISKNGLDGTWTVPQLDGVVMPEVCSIGSGPAKAA